MLLCTTLLTISGCQVTPGFNCPEKPIGHLDQNNIKNVPLDTQIVKESGTVSEQQSLGYVFEAKSGQKLSYDNKSNICVWVFTPDLEPLKSKELTKSGKYTIQISATKGSQPFNLDMTLGTLESPEELVKQHYTALSNRQYDTTWNRLSPRFQTEVVGDYSKYVDWWNRVSKIQIGSVSLVKGSGQQAVVDTQLQYVMNSGKVVNDEKRYVYLVWDAKSDRWQIDKKSSEYPP